MDHHHDDNQEKQRLEAVVESTQAKTVARFGVPLLLTIVSVLGGLAFNDIKKDLADSEEDRRQVGNDVSQIKSDVRDLNTRLDSGVIRQVESNAKTIESHESRIQALERSVRAP